MCREEDRSVTLATVCIGGKRRNGKSVPNKYQENQPVIPLCQKINTALEVPAISR
jgi:hypothetical protein